MTHEQAIEVIKEYRDNLIISPSNQLDGDVKAFDMAIQALSQEPCEKCEVGNPCLYCKHDFEPQESEDKE